MLEVAVGEVGFTNLFDPDLPNHPVLFGVLEGVVPGKAYVDDVNEPSQCIVKASSVFTFPSRQVSTAFIGETVAHLRQSGYVGLVWPSEIPRELVAPEGSRVAERREFQDCDPTSATLTRLRKGLSKGLVARRMNRNLLAQCQWGSKIETYYGGLDNFLKKGIGICLVKDDEVVSEAYVTSCGRGIAEIGVITQEKHRGKGYATIACAHLVEACRQRGHGVYWSCDVQNAASVRIAQKLGFQSEGRYWMVGYHWWEWWEKWGKNQR